MVAPDMDKVVSLMRDVAEEEIRPRFRCLQEGEIRRKDAGGLVTIADTESERRLGDALTSLLPGSVVLGEEAAEGDPAAYDCLSGDAPVWIVDPLDGTSNFASGKPDYVVIVALAVGGETRAGAILVPETGASIVAEQGEGAWSEGRRVCSDDAELPELSAMRGSLGRRLRERDGIDEIFERVNTAGCCGIEYMRIATGELHFAHYRGLKPWDHAAGDLIVREAGGRVCYIDGSPYRPGESHRYGLLSACGDECWHSVLGVLRASIENLPSLKPQ